MFIRSGSGVGWRVPRGNPLVWLYHMIFPAQAIFGLKPERHHDMIGRYFGHCITFQVTDDPKLHGPGVTIAQFRYTGRVGCSSTPSICSGAWRRFPTPIRWRSSCPRI